MPNSHSRIVLVDQAGELCLRCRRVHVDQRGAPACRAHSSRTGKACRAPRIAGGFVCCTHGGRAPHVKAAAARRLAILDALAAAPAKGSRRGSIRPPAAESTLGDRRFPSSLAITEQPVAQPPARAGTGVEAMRARSRPGHPDQEDPDA